MWSWKLATDFNIPTGLTGANELERLAVPSTDVSGSFLGKGFDAGFSGRLIRELPGSDSEKDPAKLFFGAGFTRVGTYDPTDEQGDRVSSGLQYEGFVGVDDIPFGGDTTLAFEGNYTRSQGVAGKVGNALTLTAKGKTNLADGVSAEVKYKLKVSDKRPDAGSAAIRNENLQEGLKNTLDTKISFEIDELTLFAGLSGELNDNTRPTDNTFFSTNWKAAATAGLQYNLADNVAATASLKFTETGAESSTSEDTEFSTLTSQLGLIVKF